MRSVIERQVNASYIFLGSKAHLIERMFSAKSRPFYNAAQKFMLTRPPAEESADFLVDRLKSSGIRNAKSVSESTIECDSGTYRLANPLLIHHLARQA